MTALLPSAALAANCGLLLWSVLLLRRSERLRKHAAELDRLLALLCVQCFMRQHQPVWRGWTLAMGDISVEVKQTRYSPKGQS